MEFPYADFFDGCGIKKGDIVDVAADIRSLMLTARKEHWIFDGQHLIDALKDLVGHEGTLMLRVFNWDFCHGEGFDMRTSPSRVGSLGNFALKRDDFIRTKHPLYSWMVWGKYAQELAAMNNKAAFGKKSPWEFVYDNDGLLLNFGRTEVTGFTYAHYIEEGENMPYRFSKNFKGEYTDASGNKTVREYSMYVRYLDYDIYTDLYPEVLEELYQKGAVTKKTFRDLPLWSVKLREAIDYVRDDLKHNTGKKTCVLNGLKGYGYALEHPPKLKDLNQTEDPNKKC